MAADSIPLEYLSSDPEATLAFARFLGSRLEAGVVLALSGDLGAGKTTFVRGLAAGMGIEDPVSSPTYTLMHTYLGQGLPLYHYDAWMEGRQKALLAEGGAGALETDGVVVVEWAGRVQDQLPPETVTLELGHRGETQRVVRLGGDWASWTRWLADRPAIPGWEPIEPAEKD